MTDTTRRTNNERTLPRLAPRAFILGIFLTLACCMAHAEEPLDSERDKQNADVAKQLILILRGTKVFSPPARAEAARTLGKMGLDARSIVPDLIQILSDPTRCNPFPVDEAIVRAAGDIGLPARKAIPALVGNVGKDRDLDRAISESVERILKAVHTSEALAALKRLLKDPDAGERLRAAKKLATLGPDARAAIPDLTAALMDSDRDVSRQALLALQAIRPGGTGSVALNVYIRDLGDEDEVIRLRAAKALAKLGPAAKPALPALQAAARNDPDEDVRKVAGDAVAKIQGTPP